jgi:hypothetical protein
MLDSSVAFWAPMPFNIKNVEDQRAALLELAQLTQPSIIHPTLVSAARKITNTCPSRDWKAELQAIYDAVKYGTVDVAGLERGMRYVSDPIVATPKYAADYFTSPKRMLAQCADGACAGDCDEHSALVAGLAAAIGFRAGLRAWGRARGDYDHVYAVVMVPKDHPVEWWGLDTTVPEADVGWEPPYGYCLTATIS